VQPTVEAELAAVRRSLAALAEEPGLSAVAAGDLTEAVRALERVEKTWSRILPHLVFDNAAVGNLLLDVAPEIPPELRAEIESAVRERQPDPDLAVFDVAAADARNQQLRGLLSRVIAASPPTDENAVLRSRIIACLDRSLETRPW